MYCSGARTIRKNFQTGEKRSLRLTGKQSDQICQNRNDRRKCGNSFLEDREEDWEKGHILALLEEFRRRVLKSCPETALEFGYSLDAASLGHIRQSIEKCQKALNMEMIYPSLFAWEYSQLGALAWLDIPEEELPICSRLTVYS